MFGTDAMQICLSIPVQKDEDRDGEREREVESII